MNFIFAAQLFSEFPRNPCSYLMIPEGIVCQQFSYLCKDTCMLKQAYGYRTSLHIYYFFPYLVSFDVIWYLKRKGVYIGSLCLSLFLFFFFFFILTMEKRIVTFHHLQLSSKLYVGFIFYWRFDK